MQLQRCWGAGLSPFHYPQFFWLKLRKMNPATNVFNANGVESISPALRRQEPLRRVKAANLINAESVGSHNQGTKKQRGSRSDCMASFLGCFVVKAKPIATRRASVILKTENSLCGTITAIQSLCYDSSRMNCRLTDGKVEDGGGTGLSVPPCLRG